MGRHSSFHAWNKYTTGEREASITVATTVLTTHGYSHMLLSVIQDHCMPRQCSRGKEDESCENIGRFTRPRAPL